MASPGSGAKERVANRPNAAPGDKPDSGGGAKALSTGGNTPAGIAHPQAASVGGALTDTDSAASRRAAPGSATTAAPDTRDLAGERFDAALGSVGGERLGVVTREGAGDARMLDRGGAVPVGPGGNAALTGDASEMGDDAGDEFNDVKLHDRRRPYDQLSAVDLLKALA